MKIREICNITMGQSPSSATYNENGDGLPFFQGAADFGKKFPMTRVWCSSPLKIAYAGDILISVRAPVGTMNIATSECCIGRGLAAIKVDEDACDSNYFWFALESKISELNNKGSGSTFKAISKSILEETEIPLPELEEQRKIAKILTGIENISFARQQQLAKLDELVKAQFVEMFGDPMINSMHWPRYDLSEYIQFLTSGSRGWAKYFTDEGEYFITIKNVKNCKITLDDVQYIAPPDNAEAKRTKVQAGDLLISITADLGRTGVVTQEIAEYGAYINQHLTCIRLNQSVVLPLYVAYYMESDAGKKQFQLKNQTGVKAGLNFNSINTLKVMVPPLEKQRSFVSFVEQVEKTKSSIQKNLKKIEILKKALVQRYFG